jgi:hypothetical protein
MHESKVAELEQDLVATSADIRTANKQFSNLTTKL